MLTILRDAEIDEETFVRSRKLDSSPDHPLAFRELMLSMGLHAISQKTIRKHPENFSNIHNLHAKVYNLQRLFPLLDGIKGFWLKPRNQHSHR